MSQNDLKTVDWDVKPQYKQIDKTMVGPKMNLSTMHDQNLPGV